MAHMKYTWATGDLISAERLNNIEKQYDQVKTDFFGNIMFRARKGGVTDIPNGGEYKIVFDVVDHNPQGVYNASTGAFTAPVNGIYMLCASLCFVSRPGCNGVGTTKIVSTLGIYTSDGSTYVGNDSGSFNAAVSDIRQLPAGQSVVVKAHQFTGVDPIKINNMSYFCAQLLEKT